MAEHRPAVRVRLREDQAKLYHRLLLQERSEVMRVRAEWKLTHPTTLFNQMTALIDSSLSELQRAADERGWSLGEPRTEDPQVSGPGLFEDLQRDLG